MISPQAKTAIAAIVPVALAAFYFLVPSVTPEQVTHVVAGVVVVAGAVSAIVNVFHIPSGAKTVMAEVVAYAEEVQSDTTKPTASIARVKKLADGAVEKKDDGPKGTAIAGMLALIGVSCCVIANTTACNASTAQLQQTEADAFKLAGCVLSEVFGGVTDPAAIGAQCVGALPSVIVDIIEDFEAKPADGGMLGVAPGSRAQELLDEAKVKAAQARAAAKAKASQ